MTVKELIEELQKMPQDSEAVLVHSEWPLKKVAELISNNDKKVVLK